MMEPLSQIFCPGERRQTSLLCLAVLLSVLIALFPQPLAFAAPAALKCDRSYEVKRGDTLARIASAFGRTPAQIVDENNFNPPYTIYVGQRICIPTKSVSGLPKLASKYANASAAYFAFGRTATEALIYIYNYPKTTVYIKATNASDPARKFYKIGTLNIVANQKAYRFKLPAQLQNVKNLQVCLKDRTTSYLQCATPRSGK